MRFVCYCLCLCVCVCEWVGKYCLCILVGAGVWEGKKAAQDLDPNCRVQIQPRFNQFKKTDKQEAKWELCERVRVLSMEMSEPIHSHTEKRKSYKPTRNDKTSVQIHAHGQRCMLRQKLQHTTYDSIKLSPLFDSQHTSSFSSLFPSVNKCLIQLKPLFVLYSMSVLLVFINFASVSLSALSIINADILPISSSVPCAIFH